MRKHRLSGHVCKRLAAAIGPAKGFIPGGTAREGRWRDAGETSGLTGTAVFMPHPTTDSTFSFRFIFTLTRQMEYSSTGFTAHVPLGKQPKDNVQKGEASSKKLGRSLDEPSVFHIQCEPIRFFRCKLIRLLSSRGFVLVRRAALYECQHLVASHNVPWRLTNFI